MPIIVLHVKRVMSTAVIMLGEGLRNIHFETSNSHDRCVLEISDGSTCELLHGSKTARWKYGNRDRQLHQMVYDPVLNGYIPLVLTYLKMAHTGQRYASKLSSA